MNKDPKVSKDDYNDQTKLLYANVGKIVVLSEHLNFAMFHCCCRILEAKNLPQNYSQTVIIGINLENMRRTWESLIKLHYLDDADAKGMIDHLSPRLDNIIQRRNGTVHRRWMIGWGSEHSESFEIAWSLKEQRSIGRKGAGGIKYTLKDTKDLNDIADELQKLISLVWRFSAIIGHGKFLPVANFHYDAKGDLIDRPP